MVWSPPMAMSWAPSTLRAVVAFDLGSTRLVDLGDLVACNRNGFVGADGQRLVGSNVLGSVAADVEHLVAAHGTGAVTSNDVGGVASEALRTIALDHGVHVELPMHEDLFVTGCIFKTKLIVAVTTRTAGALKVLTVFRSGSE